jgi:hypothetical protein
MRHGYLGLVLLLGLPACASTAVQAAKQGDQRDLAAQLRKRIDEGKLTRHEAGNVAAAVAEHEIRAAEGELGVKRIRELRGCARDLDGALESREKNGDNVSIEAAWARAFYGDMSAGEARDYAKASDPRLRAIAPLGYVRDDDASARRKAMTDSALEARRGAMRAAQRALDPGDVPALAEAARVDPDPIVRTDALRTLLTIGGPEVARRLRDLWTSGDEGVRGDIAVGWTRPTVFPSGGEEALRVIIGTERGPGSIEAAAGVLRMPTKGKKEEVPSAELRAMAVSRIAQTIEKDARRGRLHALAVAPVSTSGELAPVLSAVRASAKDDDLEIRITALGRLLDSPPDRAAAIQELEPVAGQPEGRHARRALFALASAGHHRIQAWVERDLASQDPETRVSALLSLVALDRAPRGATLLADADPSVRTRAACMLIGAARH